MLMVFYRPLEILLHLKPYHILGHPSYKWLDVNTQEVSCSSIVFDNAISQLITDTDGLLVSSKYTPIRTQQH